MIVGSILVSEVSEKPNASVIMREAIRASSGVSQVHDRISTINHMTEIISNSASSEPIYTFLIT